ncbi:MAG: acetoacetate decarboxylase family protein [Kofleriaceae bacterium]|nr:acetoacetate decarboxylase family protein [Kofleriaceae bacterium]
MTRPDYLLRGGDLCMSQPLALTGATMYSFLLGADHAALTRLVDAQLNPVAAGAGWTYKPLLPMAALVCADITRSWSLTPPDSDKGWMRERDFGLWIPVAAGRMRGGLFEVDRIAWYLPYVYVDNVAAMITGREVFGFFKQTATLAMPPSPTTPGDFTVDALAIPHFAPSSEATVTRLLTLASGASGPAPGASIWSGPVDAARHLVGEIEQRFFHPAQAEALPVPTWKLIETLLLDAVRGLVPMVFLRQLRDVAEPHKACYQAVVEAPSHLTAWHGGGLCHPHTLTMPPCDSHPMAADLGLASSPIGVDLGFWTQMDFEMRAGVTIAERTTA